MALKNSLSKLYFFQYLKNLNKIEIRLKNINRYDLNKYLFDILYKKAKCISDTISILISNVNGLFNINIFGFSCFK